jgi:pSer/pThr/pTyr-binding forkhead associated (FHA) protein
VLPPYSGTPGSAGAPGARRACLEVRAGPFLGVGFALSGASVTIGRDPQSAVRLDDMSVSRRHAVLAAQGGHWFVSDLSSARGTWRNGERLPPGQEFPLREGDRIQVGETVLELVSRPA